LESLPKGQIFPRNFADIFNAERSKSPAGHGFTGMVEREMMFDKHLKIGRVSQSGAFFCYAFLLFCIG
jgi:hypothetical protein